MQITNNKLQFYAEMLNKNILVSAILRPKTIELLCEYHKLKCLAMIAKACASRSHLQLNLYSSARILSFIGSVCNGGLSAMRVLTALFIIGSEDMIWLVHQPNILQLSECKIS